MDNFLFCHHDYVIEQIHTTMKQVQLQLQASLAWFQSWHKIAIVHEY